MRDRLLRWIRAPIPLDADIDGQEFGWAAIGFLVMLVGVFLVAGWIASTFPRP
ncbi:MAG TPA: hypothetical protein VE777_13840 [Gaiellales bacterium]|jgi:hypothetical protein|nr:hypothetical protein [Gaiellales bacterium]